MTADVNYIDEVIKQCHTLFIAGNDKEKALALAREAKSLVRSEPFLAQFKDESEAVWKQYAATQIICCAMVWNDKYDEAFGIDYPFMHCRPLWDAFERIIGNYLILLTIKKQKEHLEKTFEDKEFKARFLPYYEAYISWVVDENYILTRKQEFVPIMNRIMHGNKYI